MPKAHFDKVYRRYLHGHYTRVGFDVCRNYTTGGTYYSAVPCCYCGDPATCEDHVPPLTHYRDLLATHMPPDKRRLLLVPACHECNSFLGDKPWGQLAFRKRYIKRRLRLRYKALVTMPTWYDREVETLGRGLHDYVQRSKIRQEDLQERLLW